MNRCQTTRNDPVRRMQPLDSFSPAFLIISSPGKNQSKTSPKSDRFRDCEFFNTFPATTYTFNILKRSGFSPLVARALRKLPRLAESPCSCFRHWPSSAPPRLCGKNPWKQTCQSTVQNRTKPNKIERFPKHPDFGHAVPTTYDDMPSGRSISQEVSMTLTDHLLNSDLSLGPSSQMVFIVPTP